MCMLLVFPIISYNLLYNTVASEANEKWGGGLDLLKILTSNKKNVCWGEGRGAELKIK